MTKVNVGDFSKSRPVLSPDMFPKADVIPFTIATVDRVAFSADDGEQQRIVLTSEEHGENVLWLNVTGIKALVAKLGDNDDQWIGTTIPLVKVRTNNPRTKEQVTVLWVAGAKDAEMWDAVAPKKAKARGKR